MEEDDIQLSGFQLAIHMPGIRTTETFQDNVQSLDAWETSLLADVQFKGDPFTFTSQFNPQSPPQEEATDGSVLNQQGTFGWRISTDTGTHLVTCNGPLYGYTPTSYHAECYGLLSLLRFLLQLQLSGTPTQT